jgi:thioredoxin reductase (NADPH)
MYDVIIVGAGPAGLTAGIFARSRRLETLIIDAGKAGGQLVFLYPTKIIHDYPSYMRIGAMDLARLMVSHAKEQGCEIYEDEEVIGLERKEDHCVVKTSQEEYEAKTVILSIGMGLFEPRKLKVPRNILQDTLCGRLREQEGPLRRRGRHGAGDGSQRRGRGKGGNPDP